MKSEEEAEVELERNATVLVGASDAPLAVSPSVECLPFVVTAVKTGREKKESEKAKQRKPKVVRRVSGGEDFLLARSPASRFFTLEKRKLNISPAPAPAPRPRSAPSPAIGQTGRRRCRGTQSRARPRAPSLAGPASELRERTWRMTTTSSSSKITPMRRQRPPTASLAPRPRRPRRPAAPPTTLPTRARTGTARRSFASEVRSSLSGRLSRGEGERGERGEREREKRAKARES